MKGTLKKCPSCSKFFTCQGDDDCWCESFQIHRTGYLRLSQDYNNCVCPECLKKYTEK